MVLAVLGACQQRDAGPDKPTVRVEARTVERVEDTPTARLTGEIQAEVQSDLAFRVGGRITERTVDVGDHVGADQVLARLDPREQQANLAAAEAAVGAARARLRQASSAFERQKTLLERGFTTRREYDQAEEALRTARSALESAEAERATARDLLAQTELRAGVPGVVTARHAEVGQVVQAAEAVFTLAHDGPRDAVFNVQESIFIQAPPSRAVAVSLVADPGVTTVGTVREVSPAVDPDSGTVAVKVGIGDPPPAMVLGAAVVGEARLRTRSVVVLPWSALTSEAGRPAVWVVDPRSGTVSRKAVAVERYDSGRVIVGDGLAPGEVVVTVGGQLLHPAQVVEVAPGGTP
ncbi:efflux RND transporter periplasmic adaptor subunit [Azospirillum sp. ST 5-10]|uniref:efflux RND transporter periplasmic adaptor subunit n=1 Tax=unclassified Azospirillum TaxID=2630922 RepID=UPI003F49B690